jgi:uncharacterized protein YbjT (DUF2867 family)
MFAIAGVTGNTGSVVAETLLAAKHPVRVVLRDATKAAAWQAKGAEIAIAAFDDAAALTRAFSGAAGAYVLNAPNVQSTTPLESNAQITAALATAIRAAKVPHVVHLSSVGAQHADGTGPIKGLYVTERELAATGTALTSLRASYFMENGGASLGALAQGIFPVFVPVDLRFSQVATRDIGRTAAAALIEGPHGRQIIELVGPKDYSANDTAGLLSTITGKTITAVCAPLDAVVPTLTGFGISAQVAALFREMYEGITSGKVALEGGSARLVRGTIPMEDVLAGLLKH